MARNKFTFYLDQTLNPEQLDLVGKTATMLTDRPGKHAQLCDEISQELKSYLVRQSIAADKLPSKAVRDRLDRARRHHHRHGVGLRPHLAGAGGVLGGGHVLPQPGVQRVVGSHVVSGG